MSHGAFSSSSFSPTAFSADSAEVVISAASSVSATGAAVDPMTVAEDALWAWVHAGSGLDAAQVVWSDRGPMPSGLYVALRLRGIDSPASDWSRLERVSGQVFYHSRGDRIQVLELSCRAAPPLGSSRCEAVLSKVRAAIRWPSVQAILKAGDVGLGTFSAIRGIDQQRNQMFDPIAFCSVNVFTNIDHRDPSPIAEITTVDGTTPTAGTPRPYSVIRP